MRNALMALARWHVARHAEAHPSNLVHHGAAALLQPTDASSCRPVWSALYALPPRPTDAATASRQCAGLLFYLQVMVGILLPVFVVVRSTPQRALPPPPPPLAARTSSWEQRRHRAARAYAAANLAVWCAFSLPPGGLLPRGILLWLVVALSWTVTLAVHGL